MTGMEHTLHVMASVCVVLAMVQLDRGQSPSPLFLACILLAPLLRFEGVALAGAALVALLFARQFRTFLIIALVLVLILAGYAMFMTRLGLPLLPSSVLTKSTVSVAVVDGNIKDLLFRSMHMLINSLQNRSGLLLGICVGLLVLSVTFVDTTRRPPWFTLWVSTAAIGGHMIAGRYGWFDRYEI